MSAYIVMPRTIDYLVAWADRHGGDVSRTDAIWQDWSDIPEELQRVAAGDARWGWHLRLNEMTNDEIGQILITENVRSVRHRYPDDSADSLPGPVDQARVWRYRFRPIARDLDAAWVVKSCRCLAYQSCETPDWKDSVAYAILEAIREDAIATLVEDAPWGVDEEHLGEVTA